MPHLLLPVCAATGAAAVAVAAALIKQLSNALDHEAAIPPPLFKTFARAWPPSMCLVPRSAFSSVPAPATATSFSLSLHFLSTPSLPLWLCYQHNRTRWLTISMLQQWQQYDCLSASATASPSSSLSTSLSTSLSLCLSSVSVQFMI